MTKQSSGWNLDNSYLNLPDKFYSKIEPTDVTSPELVTFNDSLGKSLGLDNDQLKSKEGLKILAGSQRAPGGALIAQAYAGHQFGHFAMLGDGRAVLVGEQITPEGKRVDLQLKGSGRTPYSRGGDGLAPLGAMLREYIISEAMYGLGIPTTRSLAIVTTGEKVFRETALEGAVLTRVAKSHIRVGTFAYAVNFGGVEDTKALADYTIKRHFPELETRDNPYTGLLEEVVKAQASLIAKWQLVGFIHGVMNTDNMLISGETIDYGPCAFMDIYNPATVFSSIDRNGRYAYGNQPNIGGWNITRFAETLLPLLYRNKEEAVKIAEETIQNYVKLYDDHWLNGMRLKLGILNEEKEDKALIQELLTLMHQYKADFTSTFVGLTKEEYKSLDRSGLFESDEFKKWNEKWKSKEPCRETMRKNNPVVIPRNHLVEKALKDATEDGDYEVFNGLVQALANPYDYENANQVYMMPPQLTNVPYQTFCGT